MRAVIKCGASAWTERTLIASGWYPPGSGDAAGRLRYYATRFPIVEVDAPYYAVPSLHQAEVWRDRTPAGFTLNLKVHALLTGHYTDARRLPPDLREALPPALRDKRRLYPRDVGDELMEEIARRFRAAIDPLVRSRRLGLVLFQFPVWLPCGRAPRDEVAAVADRMPGCRVAVEFRNATWMNERNRADTLALLREHRLIYTCVDEPQGFPSSVPPVAAVTAPMALVRLHGRNAATWERRDLDSAAARMDHRYSRAELDEWVPRVRALAARAAEVHVVFNNCHGNQAVTNAAEMEDLLESARLPVLRAEFLTEAQPRDRERDRERERERDRERERERDRDRTARSDSPDQIDLTDPAFPANPPDQP